MFTAALALLLLQDSAPASSPVATLRAEAERLRPRAECAGTRAFLDAVAALPEIGERSLLYDAKTRRVVSEADFEALGEDERARYAPTPFDGEFYYTTKYGSPLAYTRALDVLGLALGQSGNDVLSGKRVLDFGYGGIGHLRLLASLGCDVVGVDVDPLLANYYRAEDQGAIASAKSGGAAGKLALVHGRWPADASVQSAVGGGYDYVLSKNTLKKGYVRPAQKADPRMLIQLGVEPTEFLSEVARALKPGGAFLIYNICPAQDPARYKPMSDGASPFTRDEYAAAGFDVLLLDQDERAACQELGLALDWPAQGMDIEDDLFAWVTLVRKKS
jgi:SAM-dependent methyltransferase